MLYLVKCDGKTLYHTINGEDDAAMRARDFYRAAVVDHSFSHGALIAQSATGAQMTLERFAH